MVCSPNWDADIHALFFLRKRQGGDSINCERKPYAEFHAEYDIILVGKS